MSVPPGDRKKSSMEFIETADKIEFRAMQVLRRWPKSWFFMITLRAMTLASAIYEHTQNANAIFPITTEKEREDRLSELHKALGATYSFAKKIERAYGLFPICGDKKNLSENEAQEKSNKLFEEFMMLCADEEEALKGNITWTRNHNLNQ